MGGAVSGSPTTGIGYVSGAPISFNGWTLALNGPPQAGDVFTVTANVDGVGDNRNALALAGLQTRLTIDGQRSTFEEFYGQIVAGVGSLTRQAELDHSARGTLHEQLFAQRESVSGVNLDEEAANLLRFQQSFQASAQLIAVADEVFNSLLAAVGR